MQKVLSVKLCCCMLQSATRIDVCGVTMLHVLLSAHCSRLACTVPRYKLILPAHSRPSLHSTLSVTQGAYSHNSLLCSCATTNKLTSMSLIRADTPASKRLQQKPSKSV
eukprot:3932-Heterococcus_DN1.PRE.1